MSSKAQTVCEITRLFAEEYMEKIFYFCLKKTGDQNEAEDLTQDIALNVLSSLHRGNAPRELSPWIWRIARNRYAVWAQSNRTKHLLFSSGCPDEELANAISPEPTVAEMTVRREEISLLRRELSFIRGDYRSLIVAYYLEHKSIGQIASALSLSETAVKQRLHRARNLLKEGMSMAREFGKMSYVPENVSFIMNGLPGTGGEPWCIIKRSLCQNILLAAYRTPSTAEELAMEVGVALPYMEEELTALTDATLLQKKGDRYETNLFIVSAGAQERIFAHLKKISPDLSKLLTESTEILLSSGFERDSENCDGGLPRSALRWAFLMCETDRLNFRTLQTFNREKPLPQGIGPWGHTIRPDGGEWDVLGMETNVTELPTFVGLHGCTTSSEERELPEIYFQQFRFNLKGIASPKPPSLKYADGEALSTVAKGAWESVHPSVLARLEEFGYIRPSGQGYLPALPVLRKKSDSAMTEEEKLRRETLLNEAQTLAEQHYRFCREQIYKEIPDFLKKNQFQIDHACANIFALRGAVLDEAIAEGYLLPSDLLKYPSTGAFLIL